MSLPRFPAYRDSGVEWLTQLPVHWQMPRLKTLLRETDERVGDREAELLGLSKSLGVVSRAQLEQGAAESNDYGKYKLVYSGQLVMNKMQAWNGVFGLSRHFGKVSPDYATFEFLEPGYNQYLSLMFSTDIMAGVFFTRCRGMGTAFLRINTGDFLDIKVPLPPISEAQSIVAFLLRETKKIDALVAEHEKLLALLAEKRQATISHAVTRGLDPGAPMKDSGVAWLGEVPGHWVVAPLKRHWAVIDCKHVTAEFVDEGVPLASIREVQGKYVSLENAKQTTDYFYEQLIEGDRKPVPQDLIFSRNATVGEVAQVTEHHPNFAMGQDVCLLRKMGDRYSSDYLQAVIRSGVVVEQLKNIMVGSTFKRVNVEEIRSLIVPMPPESEQLEIAKFIDSEATKLDKLKSEAERTIDLLKERRSALIAAAVTGKIDVRSAVNEELAA